MSAPPHGSSSSHEQTRRAHRLADLEQVGRRVNSRITFWQGDGGGGSLRQWLPFRKGRRPRRSRASRASLVRGSRIAPVVWSDKKRKAATVPDALVRAVASPKIKRIVTCVARKQDKQRYPGCTRYIQITMKPTSLVMRTSPCKATLCNRAITSCCPPALRMGLG